MSFEEIAIRVQDISKRYELYDNPRDRLKQFLLPRAQRLAGRQEKTYFREFWALRGISFEVKKGESVGIVGRNGSGKSTLLQLIAGTVSPTSGTVNTVGRLAALLELGSGFNPDFTGRENVFLNGALLGLSNAEIEAKFDAIAAFADIGQFMDQPVKTYSTGMLVRLAFAVQAQVDPDILIVDEALAVGDALFQKRCFQKIEKLISDGVTLLFVSHDQESIRTLTSRSLLLRRGCAAAWGSSAEVLLEYRRQLHDEEAAYFDALTQHVSETAKSASDLVKPEPARDGDSTQEHDATPLTTSSRSASMSFGDERVRVTGVQTFDSAGAFCTVFYPGDHLRVRVECASAIESDKLNVAIRIRNKEGIKIYSWGTLNQDMQILASLKTGPLFWRRRFSVGERFEVWLECECTLGINLYEIQAAVSYEAKPDYSQQRILHWVDEAAFFQVLMRHDQYFFAGVVDLKMQARWGGDV